MTDRWERELGRLRGVDAPAGIRTRVEEGPRGVAGPGPSRNQRVLAGVVAFAFFGAALALASGALGDGPAPVVDDPSVPPGKDVAVIRLRATPDEPVGTLTYGDSTIQGSYGSYCWEQPSADSGVEACVIAERGAWSADDYLPIPEGAEFVLDADVEAEAIGILVGPGDVLSADGPAVDVASLSSLRRGSHVLSVSVPWPQGVVVFDFPILIVEPELEPSAEPAEDVILTLTGGDAPAATLTFDRVEAPSQVGSYCWNSHELADDGVVASSCVDTVLTPFSADDLLQIGAGARLALESDGDTEVTAELGLISGLDPTAEQLQTDVAFSSIEPGPWIVVVTTSWDGQDEKVRFYFGIQVGSSGGPDDLILPDLVGMDHQEASLLLDDLGLEYGWAWREVPSVELGHVASTDPVAGTEVSSGDHVLLVIATEITPISDGPDALDCAEDEYVAFGGPDTRIDPGADAYIRGNLGGIELTDEVVQITSTDPDFEWNGSWHVIRDGLVIAVVDFESLDGVACQGSGVAGA